MAANSIVEALDVLEDRSSRLLPRPEGRSVDQLHLQRREEALGYRVVPAVALATHAARHTVNLQKVSIRRRSVLAASVGMVDQRARRAAVRQGHAQGPQREFLVDTRPH
jgi:hypothetical protein